MRLINTTSLQIHEFVDNRSAPPYATLSHCWGKSEVSFKDYVKGRVKKGDGYDKILNCCSVARKRKTQWVWIDTCCIDKRSSSELSEAINSMFNWYAGADECYIYMHDVTATLADRENLEAQLRSSKWFTRGWTLQELIASRLKVVLNKDWRRIKESAKFDMGATSSDAFTSHGSSSSWIQGIIASVTGIHVEFVADRPLHSICDARLTSVAERLSWTQNRQTTRIEDTGYCLLGLLKVNMPLLYGEGLTAYSRLQVETLNQTGDESIFAWGFRPWVSFMLDEIDLLSHTSQAFKNNPLLELVTTHYRPPIRIVSQFGELRLSHGDQGAFCHRKESTLILMRLNCAQRHNNTLSPCIIFLRHLSCGHFVRVTVPDDILVANSIDYEAATCFEDDLKSPTEWMPWSSGRVLLLHLNRQGAIACSANNIKSPQLSLRLKSDML